MDMDAARVLKHLWVVQNIDCSPFLWLYTLLSIPVMGFHRIFNRKRVLVWQIRQIMILTQRTVIPEKEVTPKVLLWWTLQSLLTTLSPYLTHLINLSFILNPPFSYRMTLKVHIASWSSVDLFYCSTSAMWIAMNPPSIFLIWQILVFLCYLVLPVTFLCMCSICVSYCQRSTLSNAFLYIFGLRLL